MEAKRELHKRSSFLRQARRSRQLYLILALPLLYLLIFKYYPMLGAQIAFKDYSISKGVWDSPWVGFKHFIAFFDSYQFSRIMINTLVISLYSIVASFPIPIILAVCINSMRGSKFKKTVQMATYLPYFISTVVLVGMLNQLFGMRLGLVNNILEQLGLERMDILGNPRNFRHLYVWSGIWQGMGYSAIVYISALTSIDQELYEAARIDGATRFQQVLRIELPQIIPTAMVLLVLNTGSILNLGFEKIYLMQNPMNLEYSEVIATYVYEVGIKSTIPMYSYSTAVGLFTSVINLIMLVLVNWISRKMTNSSLW